MKNNDRDQELHGRKQGLYIMTLATLLLSWPFGGLFLLWACAEGIFNVCVNPLWGGLFLALFPAGLYYVVVKSTLTVGLEKEEEE